MHQSLYGQMISAPVLLGVCLLGFGVVLVWFWILRRFSLVSLGVFVCVCCFRRISCFYFAIKSHEEENDLKDETLFKSVCEIGALALPCLVMVSGK